MSPEARPPPGEVKEQDKSFKGIYVVNGGKKKRSRCGVRNRDGVRIRVANSRSAQFGEWPNMCMLLRRSSAAKNKLLLDESLVGGASLVAPGVAITAAHILRSFLSNARTFFNKILNMYRSSDPREYLVRCGEWDTKSDSEPLPHQERRVARITAHPSYKRSAFYDNNIALLHLESDLVVEEHVSPACLPDEDLGVDSYTGDGCWATGWGRDQFGTLLH